MITKKTVNGKDLVTSCTIANCCLTIQKLENGDVKLTNEKNQELICNKEELREIFMYMKENMIINLPF